MTERSLHPSPDRLIDHVGHRLQAFGSVLIVTVLGVRLLVVAMTPLSRRHRLRAPLIVSPARPWVSGAEAPRTDFLEIARELSAPVLYPPEERGLLAGLERHTLRVSARQVLQARAARPSLYVSLAERTGLPLALAAPPDIPQLLIAHNLTTKRRRAVAQRTGYLRRFARILVFSRAQRRYLTEEAGIPAERAVFVPYGVDERFYAPSEVPSDGYVLAVGREQRDYPTLLEAVRPLGVRTVIVASSAWLAMNDLTLGNLSPEVEVLAQVPYPALRELYRGAALVVTALQPDTDYAAGITAVLETMASQRPAVVSDSPGMADHISDGQTGRVVPAGNPVALREAIAALLRDRSEAARLAANARGVVERHHTLDGYVRTVVAAANDLVAPN